MKLQFVEGAAQWYKRWSIWGLLIISLLPELQALIIGSGLVGGEAPEVGSMSWILKAVALVTAIASLIKQKRNAEGKLTIAAATK